MACILLAMKTKTPHPGAEALRRAIKRARGTKRLAELIGERTTPQAVSNWVSRGVPMERCPVVQHLTGVTCEELRPDVDWAALRAALTSCVVSPIDCEVDGTELSVNAIDATARWRAMP
ncbi:YdaS family helix-turn-helix protein [Burkholderia ambifaria]|jgi:DNA-binding transcriptional regulator YdaS (Cro superfamily)|uniref:YdaS family helix-turn-helix protein n=2 Tax=Burkholderia TaxID=32008 RepID=UPI003C7BDC41